MYHSFKAKTAKHRATSTKTALWGLLMAAPGVWMVNAAPGVSLDAVVANKLEAKSLDSVLIAKRDNDTETTSNDDDDPWLMPNDKFYDHHMDEYWAKRGQSSVHGRSSLIELAHKKRTLPVYDAG